MRPPLLNSAYPPPSLSLDFTQGFDSRIAFTRGSSATRFNAAGVLESLSSNLPRLDYDPVTLSPKGLLIEEQRTNLVSNGDAGGTGAQPANTAVASSAIAKIYAAATMLKHARDTAQADTNVGAVPGITVSSGQVYAGSVWLWIPSSYSGSGLTLAMEGTGGGSVVTATQIDMAKRDRWQRIWVAYNSGTATSLGLVLRMTGAATGDFVYSQCWQMELGAFPTSYIKTTGTTATRSADVASMGVTPWYNQNEGTLFAEFTPEAISPGINNAFVAQFDDGSLNNRNLLFVEAVTHQIRASTTIAGVASTNLAGPALSANATCKCAFAMKSGQRALAVNGAVVGTDALAIATGLTTLRLGNRSGDVQLNGWLRKVRYWPRRLPDNDLRSLTR